jgi:hypothetical protein
MLKAGHATAVLPRGLCLELRPVDGLEGVFVFEACRELVFPSAEEMDVLRRDAFAAALDLGVEYEMFVDEDEWYFVRWPHARNVRLKGEQLSFFDVHVRG